jgi:type IV secretory pathway VirJ component
MTSGRHLVFSAGIIFALALPIRAFQAKPLSVETLRYEKFGLVRIYRESPHPAHVVLFNSGRAGWNEHVDAMARALSALDALVVGVDVPRFFRALAQDGEACSYLSAEFEDLSHYTQQKLGFPNYVIPILAGYDAGATLTYAALVQTPTGAFRGGVSLGFAPNLLLPKKPCSASGFEWETRKPNKGLPGNEYLFKPAPGLAVPWTVLQGGAETAYDVKAAAAFLQPIPHAHLVSLPGVSHAFPVQADWLPELQREFRSLVHLLEEASAAPRAPEVKDLPLVEVPAPNPTNDAFAVIISGDGGWAGIDRSLGQTLAQGGVSVVGINSLQYFWNRRTPDSASADLGRILRHYLAAWQKRRAILIGYSMGADVLPFMASRLPADLLSKVPFLALLGLSSSVDFEFHFAGWFGNVARTTDLPVAPEVAKLKGKPMLCVYGLKEEDALCTALPAGLVRLVPMPDGHHFGGDYQTIAKTILNELKPPE